MLNNITNFFNLIKTGMVKTQLESTDLIPTGTRDSGYSGSYKPTMIKYSDLASQILSGVPPLTIGITPIVSGSVGKLLYEGAGNVLNESPVFNIDPLTGFLGAGTSTPQYAIDMQFNTLGFYSAPNYYAYLGLNNGSFYLNSYSDFIFGTSSVGNGLIIKQNGNILINTGTDAGFRLDVNGTARVQGNAQFGTGFYWDNTNNRLGIGTSTPLNTLDVSGTVRLLSGGSYLTLNGATFSELGYSTNNYFRANGSFAIVNGPIIQFLRSGNEVARFAATTGNVLINTTTDAGFRLDVNGTARVISTLTSDTDIFRVTNGSSANVLRVKANGDFLMGGSTDIGSINGLGIFMRYNLRVGSLSLADASAVLQADSTTQGFLPPRMDSTQKNAISGPAPGLIIYDTTLNRPCFYNGTTWITL
jgi:hypothetical protein